MHPNRQVSNYCSFSKDYQSILPLFHARDAFHNAYLLFILCICLCISLLAQLSKWINWSQITIISRSLLLCRSLGPSYPGHWMSLFFWLFTVNCLFSGCFHFGVVLISLETLLGLFFYLILSSDCFKYFPPPRFEPRTSCTETQCSDHYAKVLLLAY